MSSNLIPQKLMDKTGKLVTRHVRAGVPASSATASLPAPSVTLQPKKKKPVLKAPLAKQREVQHRMISPDRLSVDPEIFDVLDTNPEHAFFLASVVASDVQLYDMYSVVSTSNAAMLISQGIKTPSEAIGILESNGLGHLILDRREMMDKAQSLRVSAWNLMEAPSKFGVDELSSDSDRLIQAVRLDDSVSLPRWKTNLPDGSKSEDSYAHHVINDLISYDDVMSMGLSFLSNRESLAPKICGYLNDIHEGRTDYDVKVLEHVVMRSRDRASIFDDAMGMVGEYGPDFIMEINSMDAALTIDREYRSRPTSQRADMIRYGRDGGLDFINLSSKDIVRLFDNDIPVDVAKEMMKRNMNAEQVIAVHKEGVSQPVVSGWL
jgi:hypothetical protein